MNSDGFRKFAKTGAGSGFFRSRTFHWIRTAKYNITTAFLALQHPGLFRNVRTYITFIGHMKSGGSMIGSFLDAHPNVILSDEVYALRYVQAGFRREQIFHLLRRASQRELWKGRVTSHNMSPYSWLVPNQWQGRYQTPIMVVGDSSTGDSTKSLGGDIHLLANLQNVMGDVHVKFIQVIRNPYDPMSVMMIRGKRSFENAFEAYFSDCDLLVELRDRIGAANIFSICYEDFVRDTGIKLSEICAFVGVPVIDEHLQACAGIVTEAVKPRDLVSWKPEWIEAVQKKIADYDFLQKYTFEY